MKRSDEPTILLIDGSNLAHRCRHTFNLSFGGEDVSVHYGFLRVLWTRISALEPDAIIVCWDNGIPSYRREWYPDYKVHRTHDDDEGYAVFLKQVGELHALLGKMGILSVRKSKCEADDLLVRAAMMSEGHKIIMTSDKDLLSIVGSDVTVYSPVKDVEVTPENFEEVVGVPQKYWGMYRILVGDGSDGIAGIKGIGPKTAQKLYEDYPEDFYYPGILRLGTLAELGATAKKIAEAGDAGVVSLMRVMGYGSDIAGAARTLLAAGKEWRGFRHKEVAYELKRRAYISLMDPDFYEPLSLLENPLNFMTKRVKRTPAMCEQRYPVVEA